jgi:hypothetical protein
LFALECRDRRKAEEEEEAWLYVQKSAGGDDAQYRYLVLPGLSGA